MNEKRNVNMLELVKSGKKVEIDLSFLNEDQNKLLTKYINRKSKKKFYLDELYNEKISYKDLKKKARKRDSPTLDQKVKDSQEKVIILTEKNEKYKFLRFPSIERQRLHRISRKIKKKINEFDEKGSEYKKMKDIIEYLNI